MEHTENMEEAIRYLLQQDQAAQAKLRENQQRRQQMADEMAKVREDMQKEKSDQAQHRVDMIEEREKADYQEELRRLRASYDAALADLQRNYETHRDEWVKNLVERCLS